VGSVKGKAVSVLILGTVNPPKYVDQLLGTGFEWVLESRNVLKQIQNDFGESTFVKCATVLILNQTDQAVLL
jgi:hypothetical protein